MATQATWRGRRSGSYWSWPATGRSKRPTTREGCPSASCSPPTRTGWDRASVGSWGKVETPPKSYSAYPSTRWCGLRSPSATPTSKPAGPAPAAVQPVNRSTRSCTTKGTVERMMNSSFDPETLNLLDETEEVYIETSRDADSPEHRTIIWGVVVGDEVFVRSVRGRKGRWYQRISTYPESALLVGDIRIPVRATPVTDAGAINAVSEAF